MEAHPGFLETVIATQFDPTAETIILEGDSAETLKTLSDGSVKLIITPPPYNLGKAYEKTTGLSAYLENLAPVVDHLIRVLAPDGSLCWQVGNYVEGSEIFPLDIFYYFYFKHRKAALVGHRERRNSQHHAGGTRLGALLECSYIGDEGSLARNGRS